MTMPDLPRRPLILNAFGLGAVSPSGLWAHPDDNSTGYTRIEHWIELAKRLERGGFDGIFMADTLGHQDVYGGNADAALRNGVQSPLLDPLLLVSAMAAATEHVGFGVTVSTTYEQPYQLARKFSTLDHVTNGRIAWNIVTSLQESAARNLGLDRQVPHDERYDRAQEFMEVCYKLWEGSWEDRAVVADRAAGVYADARRVHPIDHVGRYYRVPGAHLSEPSPQRTPVLYQAGASPRGREFAARNAEVVFLGGHSAESVKRSIDLIRGRAVELGRAPDSIRFITAVSVITGATDAEAQARYAELTTYPNHEAALVLFSTWTGVDWSKFDPDQPLVHIETEASRSTLAAFTQIDKSRTWTLRAVAEYMGIGGIHPKFVGSGERVVDEMVDFADRTGLDGYALADAVFPGTFEDFIREVVPVLRDRGLVRPYAATPQTLRERYQGTGQRRLRDDHPGAQFRKLDGSGSER
ncbi:LLM class flavin-dependent oxidoreductase [Micromonospora sp. NBC_01655]|uniref:LLM class flavin-dependent oxidoreductase n=1 Tax=Micromonospora sp. NBC_01655 TaxID=2975983 RepID=UPI0022591A5F|nr:LLM class flavin-dependent oxidoreductase [Micromonospora sp. NBC_01655]MCX4474634.1 LLM class flavin-dependent oxidoreductase [Micromonospora sp. NBC_01655]